MRWTVPIPQRPPSRVQFEVIADEAAERMDDHHLERHRLGRPGPDHLLELGAAVVGGRGARVHEGLDKLVTARGAIGFGPPRSRRPSRRRQGRAVGLQQEPVQGSVGKGGARLARLDRHGGLVMAMFTTADGTNIFQKDWGPEAGWHAIRQLSLQGEQFLRTCANCPRHPSNTGVATTWSCNLP